MSYFDDASLVMIPSGYKTSKVYSVKPTDGSGDLTFTRSNDTATRVGPDGLIEKVRTNLLLQSNTFSTTWVNSNSSETGGQSGYDGTSDAWLLDKSGANGQLNQSVSSSGVNTFSVYAKAGTSNWLRLTPFDDSFFDLQNGIAYASGSTTIAANIVSVGGGWYRCSITYNATSSIVRIIVADSSSSSSGTSGNIYIQDAQLETGDIATDYIPTTTAAVSVGPVANVPRLDYLNSSCPRLLLEPQRTNLVTYSEYIADSSWIPINATITSNYGTSPEGVQNSSRIVCSNTTDSRLFISYGGTLTDGTVYTWSGWYKGTAGEKVVINAISSGGSAVNASKVITFTGDWQREDITFTAGTSLTYVFPNDARVGSDTTATDFQYYGAQLEAGAYATSYIPTLGAAVTRGADSASKTGISSLIGQTEGTLFAEIDYVNTGDIQNYINISDGTLDNRINVSYNLSLNCFVVFVRVGGSTQALMTSATSPSNGIKKIAVAYKLNDYVLYINGTQIAIDSSALVPACSSLQIGSFQSSGGEYPSKQALVFKTRLTNAQLAELTTL